MVKPTHLYKTIRNTRAVLIGITTGYRARTPMEHYDFSIPKWIVWTSPFIFAAGFAVFFNGVGYFFHPPNCSSFKTQAAAQSLFNTSRTKYSYMDINHDGIACNGL